MAQGPKGQKRVTDIVTFILLRLAFGAFVLLAIIFLSYVGLDMARGSAFSPAVVQAGGKTVAYLTKLAQGDLGLSTAGSITKRPIPITEVISTTLPRSLGLLGAALLIAALVGTSLGLLAAVHRHRRGSLIFLLASIVGVSVPSFFAAFLLQSLVIHLTRIVGWRLLPVGGFGWDAHIVLPALVLAARPVAQIARITFVKVEEVLEQDFVRTAYSKGLKLYQVLFSHAIRNAAVPILTTIGVSLRFCLCSLPVVEYFFGWPGVGFNLLKTIGYRDDNTTVALLLCLGLLFILVNLILEVSYRFIDPRLRESTQTHLGRDERRNPVVWLKASLAALLEMVTDNRLVHRLTRVKARRSSNQLRSVRKHRRRALGDADSLTSVSTRKRKRHEWIRIRGAFDNLPLLAGVVLVALMVTIVLFGPRLAPHSPYTTQGLKIVEGEFSVPPFPPDQLYPWGTDVLGRDIMSLILAGAQRTLFLVTLVVAARMLVGFIAGAVAGWLNGSWIDRLLLRASETIASFPMLLLAMILILALGIRQGFRPFVIALCFIGWGEIMQFVRGEVLTLRAKPFIEGAVAVGARTPRIILSHMLPHMVPALIAIITLEMGAVLMLLGELGFLGIFIGGGAFAELQIWAPPFHYSDVPEWGALLSSIRTYARSYPWMALYPSLAFFVAILGFNLFGEGVRRMLEKGTSRISRFVNRYTIALALIMVLGIGLARWNIGAVATYYQQAKSFDGDLAFTHVQALTDPALEGRGLGTPGMKSAAEYIAQQFETLGLQAAGEEYSYFYTRPRAYESLDAVPKLIIEDGNPQPVYRYDYTEYPGYYRNLGQGQGNIRFLATGELTERYLAFRGGDIYPALEGLEITGDDILLVPSAREARYLSDLPCGGVLVIAKDVMDMGRRYTLPPRDPTYKMFGSDRVIGQDLPKLWLSEATANRILKNSGYTVAEMRRISEELERDEVFDLPTEVNVSMTVQGTVHEKVPVLHVIGHLPGKAGNVPSAREYQVLDDQVIVVLAQYDSPPTNPSGVFYPGANNNASGVGVMLEAIRTMQETGYQPYRTFLFVAYSGEGLEGGREVCAPEAAEFLKAKYGFSSSLNIEAVVRLRGLGAGTGRTPRLALSTQGSERLMSLFEDAAHRLGVRTRRVEEAIDMSIIYTEKSAYESAQEAPEISLSWMGWEETAHRPTDTLDAISTDRLEQAGRALTLALMIMGRGTRY